VNQILTAGAMDTIRTDLSGLGVFASLPASPKTGDQYQCTDQATRYVYTGSAWLAVSGSALWFGAGNPNGALTDFAPHNMTTDSLPSPYVASASAETYGAAYKCFDGSTILGSGCWEVAGVSGTVELDIGSGNSQILVSYTLTAPDSYDSRMCSAWTMQGSNDNSTWNTLDTQSGQLSWGVSEARNFLCATAVTAYRYFQIVITDNSGDSYLAVGEINLYYSAGSPFAGGMDGDFYMETLTKSIWGPLASGTWPLFKA
jgi:hypothetical protein